MNDISIPFDEVYLIIDYINYYKSLLMQGISYEQLYNMLEYEYQILDFKEKERKKDKPNVDILKAPTIIMTKSECKLHEKLLKDAKDSINRILDEKIEKTLKFINKENTTLD